ncbi:MAG: glycosyltransferase family 9 protein [Tepidisphaeraceae bacterium]|jgi:ADP-heptose:LPS heptosyltransferase
MFSRNVLIFHSGALGDFVHTWPLGLALGRLYPQSRVIYVTQRQKGVLVEKVLRLEFMDTELGWHHLFGDAASLPEVCRQKLASAHSIFTFIARPGDAWMRAAGSVAAAAQTISMEAGAAGQLVDSLSGVPAVRAAVGQILASIAERGIHLSRPPVAGPVGIHPGAGSPQKCWPLDGYLELIDRLHDAGHRCRIFLGEVEIERWTGEEIRRLQSADETVQPATYLDLFRELSACSAFVGNDSGPGQLAGIIGLPSVILFGPTDPAVWKPLGPRVAVLRGQPLASLPAEQVCQAVLRSLPQTFLRARAD